ncbi:unnamed protein product [Calypogeia fissa]
MQTIANALCVVHSTSDAVIFLSGIHISTSANLCVHIDWNLVVPAELLGQEGSSRETRAPHFGVGIGIGNVR